MTAQNDRSFGGLSRRAVLAGISGGVGLLAAPAILRAEAEAIRIGFPTPLTGPFGAESSGLLP